MYDIRKANNALAGVINESMQVEFDIHTIQAIVSHLGTRESQELRPISVLYAPRGTGNYILLAT